MTIDQNISTGQTLTATGGRFNSQIFVDCKILDVQKNRYYVSYRYESKQADVATLKNLLRQRH
jgi:hypothetical protein